MVGKFLLGMVSGGLVITGGLIVASALFPVRPANDNAPAEVAEPIAAPEATSADAGPATVAETPAEPEAAPEAAPVEAEAEAAAVEPTAPVAEATEPEVTEAEPAAEPAAAEPASDAPAEIAAAPAADPAADESAAASGPDVVTAEPAVEPLAETQPAVETATAPPAPEAPVADIAEPVAPAATEVASPETLAEPSKPADAAADVAATAPAAPEPAAEAPAETELAEASPDTTAVAPAPAEPAPAAEAAPTEAPAAEATAEAGTEPAVAAEPAPAPTEPAPDETIVIAEAAPEPEMPVVEASPEPAPEPAPEAAPEPEPAEAPAEAPAAADAEAMPTVPTPETAQATEAEAPDATPGAEVPVMPGTRPEALPGDAEVPAVEAEGGSTFKPAPGLPRAGEGAIIDRDEAAEPAPADPAAAPADPRPIAQFAATFENPEAKPPFAIVLIDDGSADLDRAALAALPFPVSFALNPLDPASAQHAATYRAAGKEVVMLVTGIAEGAMPADVEVAFQSMEQGLPEAVAVMDLAEPTFQNRRPLAATVVPILKAQGRGLLTWDEGLNAADQVARREDLEAAVIFRDLGSSGADAAAVRRLLDRAVFKAGQEGRVSVVGQADPATVAALLEWTVEGKAATVALAPVTAVLTVE